MRKLYFRVIGSRGLEWPSIDNREKCTFADIKDEGNVVDVIVLKRSPVMREAQLKLLWKIEISWLFSSEDYPLTVEVYANPDDTEPLFTGEIREVVSHEFSLKETK